ncbi:HNH endonuclease [Myxococcus sp. RHSTA-1-4]|uniref:HNH endonuclease n=1 Tax=Myxococcus sp. RHSTA-1-4 TaxID=2874601 RepID=UPI00351D20D2|nr:HNH endonuclease [Myxococcus sp. RHSTA-1-4]
MKALRDLLHLLANGARRNNVPFGNDSSTDFVASLKTDYASIAIRDPSPSGFTWHEISSLLAVHKLFWTQVPVAVLNPNAVDIRPYAKIMANALLATPSEADIRAIHAILKRMRRYAVFGRPTYSVSREEFSALLRSQSGRCNTCGHKFSDAEMLAQEYLEEPDAASQIGPLRPPQLDHIVPIFLAGHDIANCQILCLTCNTSKGASLFWPIKSAVIGPSKPSDLASTSATQRWMIFTRDGRCTNCLRRPTELRGDQELVAHKVNPELGWTLENSRTLCTHCAAPVAR